MKGFYPLLLLHLNKTQTCRPACVIARSQFSFRVWLIYCTNQGQLLDLPSTRHHILGGVGEGKPDSCVELKQFWVTGGRNARAESVEVRMTPSFYTICCPQTQVSAQSITLQFLLHFTDQAAGNLQAGLTTQPVFTAWWDRSRNLQSIQSVSLKTILVS